MFFKGNRANIKEEDVKQEPGEDSEFRWPLGCRCFQSLQHGSTVERQLDRDETVAATVSDVVTLYRDVFVMTIITCFGKLINRFVGT